MKFKKWMIGLATVSALALAGCENNQSAADSGTGDEEATSGPAVGIKEDVTNDGEPIKGATLKVALVVGSPFKGVYSEGLATEAYDADLMQFSHEELFCTEKTSGFPMKDRQKLR